MLIHKYHFNMAYNSRWGKIIGTLSLATVDPVWEVYSGILYLNIHYNFFLTVKIFDNSGEAILWTIYKTNNIVISKVMSDQ